MNEIKKTFAAKTLLHFYGSDALEQSKRIEQMGKDIASKQPDCIDADVVSWFAYLHAMDLPLKRCRNSLLFELSDEQMKKLAIACNNYTKPEPPMNDATIKACIDAYWMVENIKHE